MRRIVQSRQSTVKNLLTMLNIISLVWRSDIESAHPWRLTMVLCSSMKTRKRKSRYNVLWWVSESSAIEKPQECHKMSAICYRLIAQTTRMNLLTS
jgi:hypothetical protein